MSNRKELAISAFNLVFWPRQGLGQRPKPEEALIEPPRITNMNIGVVAPTGFWPLPKPEEAP